MSISADSKIAAYQRALQTIENSPPSDHPLDAQNPEMGLSGKRLISSLQKLAELACNNGEYCYVEVGTYRGLTLLSVAGFNPSISAYGIDNFSQFDPDGKNERLISERAKQLHLQNVNLIKNDFEAAFDDLFSETGGQRVGCYLVDGPHDYRSQLVCLTLARKYLASSAVIFVDDLNYEHVRLANKDFLLAFPEFKLLFEAYGEAHPNNLSQTAHRAARDEYWNGVNILVHDPDDILELIYPPVTQDRTRYLNEHLVHASLMAEAAPEAMRLAASLRSPWRLPRAVADVLKQRSKWATIWRDRFPDANTYSTKSVRHATLR